MAIIFPKLSDLRLSPLNTRQVKPSAIESMADDLDAHGLIQNLVAYEEDGLYFVFAGGRRYRGLKLLAKRKRIKNSDTFPVDLRTKAEAIELSLAENTQREDMHPADSIRAFAALRDAGMDVSEIAARYGRAESFVYRMLRLSALNPQLIRVLAKDQMTLEAAKALTLTDDHDHQMKAWKATNGEPRAIRRMLTQEKVTMKSGAFLFVGREAYEAKGGTFTVDLFAAEDESYADQPEIVQELAKEKLDELAEEYGAAGWHEVHAVLTQPYDLYSKPSLYEGRREPTEEEAARLAAIDAELAEAGEDSDVAALYEERDAITTGLKGFTDEQRAVGGVALWVMHDGRVGTRFYRAKAERTAKADTISAPAPIYPGTLFSDLTRIKTQIVQEAVAANPELALDVLLDCLSGQLLHNEGSYQNALEVRASAINTAVPPEMMSGSDVQPIADSMAARFADLPTEGRFGAIREMDVDDKLALLGGLVAMMLDGTVFAGGSPGARHHHFEQIAKAAEVNIAGRWSPPIALFDRMKRAGLVALLRQEKGDASADNCATIKKKADLAVNVHGRLDGDWVPEPMKVGAFDKAAPEPRDDPDADAFDDADADGMDDGERIDMDEDTDEMA
jgi:ParB family chromosome partitioning protein